MASITKNQNLRIKEGRTELTTTHQGQDLTFVHPSYGPDTYANVGSQIEQAGLIRPTMSQITSLAHTSCNSNDKYSKEIQKIMKDNWLWGFTGTLYVPNKGAYIQEDPQIRNGMPFMDESDLVRKLEANDPNVRFVPFGFKTEEMTPIQLANNDYVKALVGEEGAEKLAEISDKHRYKPYLYSFESVDEPLTRVSALLSNWNLDDRLYVLGNYHGFNWYGYSFGVSRTGEASRVEK